MCTVWEPLDIASMRQAAAYLTGEHDFKHSVRFETDKKIDGAESHCY